MLAVTLHNVAIQVFKEYFPNGCPYEEKMKPHGVRTALEHPQHYNYSQYPNDTFEPVGYFA